MKRSLSLLIILFLVTILNSNTQAQCYETIAYNRISPGQSTTPTSLSLGDEEVSSFISIGFTFNFFGNNYTQLKVSSNGFVTFDNTSDASYNGNTIPANDEANNLIAFGWGDLDPASGGNIEYFTIGTAPNRKFVLNFDSVPHWGTTDSIIVQLVLYEGTNNIEIHTKHHEADGNSTMGVENAQGTTGFTVSGRNDAFGWTAQNEGIRFPMEGVSVDSDGDGTVNCRDGCPNDSNKTSPGYCGCGAEDTDTNQDSIPDCIEECIDYDNATITYNPVSPNQNDTLSNLALGDEEMTSFIPLDFSFKFFGVDYNQVKVSSNGFISFQDTAETSIGSYNTIPENNEANNVIAFAWGDLDPSSGGNITYYTTGSAPNRKFVLNFDSVPYWGTTDSIITQLILYENSNNIEIHSKYTPSGTQFTTMGIESFEGDTGYTVNGRNNASGWTAQNEGIRFSPADRDGDGTPDCSDPCPDAPGTVTTDSITVTACSDYTVPSGDETYTTSGTYEDTLTNAAGCDSIIFINLTINTINTSITQSNDTLRSEASGASYQWLNCSNGHTEINGETNQFFVPQASGDYAVEVNKNGCIDTSSCFNIIVTGVIQNNFNASIKAYPNPTQGQITVELGKAYEEITLQLTNNSGQVVSKRNLKNTNQFVMPINEPAGTYILVIETGTGQMARIQIVKK